MQLVSLVIGLGVVAAVAAPFVSRWWSWRVAVRHRVLVHFGDETAQGIMWQRRGDLLVLRDASMLIEGTPQPVPADGMLVIERDRVVFIQVLDGDR